VSGLPGVQAFGEGILSRHHDLISVVASIPWVQ
jgi:hypothetical protein